MVVAAVNCSCLLKVSSLIGMKTLVHVTGLLLILLVVYGDLTITVQIDLGF